MRLDFHKSYPPPSGTSLKNKILLTLLITASTLACNYSLKESLYLFADSTYFWCTSLHILSLGLAIKALRGSRGAFWACIIVLFLNGTLIELPCVFQGCVAFIAMIGFALNHDKKSASICCAFWLTSILAFSILYFAPGTSERMAGYVPTMYQEFVPHVKRALLIGFAQGFLTTLKFLAMPLNYVFLLFLPLIIKNFPQSKTKLKIWQILLIIYFIAVLMQTAHGWGLCGRLTERGEAATLWSMNATWCWLLSRFYHGKITTSEKFAEFSRKWRYPFLILALLISFNFWDAVKDLKIAPAFKAENVARVQHIIKQRDAGVEEILVTVPFKNKPKFLYSDLPVMLENGSFSKFYGAKSVLAVPEALSSDLEAIDEIRQGSILPLKKLADAGDPTYAFELGVASEPFLRHNAYGESKSRKSIEASNDQAEKYYRLGAEAGDVNCMWTLARTIYTKDKSFKGISEAIYWAVKYQLYNTRL